MITPAIDAYYKHRGLVPPNRLQALLFLLSEIGELVDAYQAEFKGVDSITHSESLALQLALTMGRMAEDAVSEQAGWVRNNDRVKTPALAPEIGDVLMMLDRFSKAAGKPSPEECLYNKMHDKGFEVVGYLLELNKLLRKELEKLQNE